MDTFISAFVEELEAHIESEDTVFFQPLLLFIISHHKNRSRANYINDQRRHLEKVVKDDRLMMQMRWNVKYLNRLGKRLHFFVSPLLPTALPSLYCMHSYTPINTAICAMMCLITRALLQLIFSLISFTSSLSSPLHSNPLC